MSTPRNAPCPCGSGRKYKHCCRKVEADAMPAAARAAGLHHEAAREVLMGLAMRSVGFDGLAEAMAEFSDHADWDDLDDESLLDAAFDGPRGELAGAWFVSMWTQNRSADGQQEPWPSEHSIAAEFLAQGARRVTPQVCRFIEAWRRSPFTFWQVEAVEPGVAVRLRDLVLDRELLAYDRSLSNSLTPGDHVFVQVVDVDGMAIVTAMAGAVIPASLSAALRETLERLKADRAMETVEDVFGLHERLFSLYFAYEEATLEPADSPVQNTDDEALVSTLSMYAVATGRMADLRAALLATPGISAEDEDDPQPTVLHWIDDRPGRMLDNTMKGRISLEGDTLSTLCNSRERDAALRRMVASAAGDLLTHQESIAMPMSRAQLMAMADQAQRGLTDMDEARMAELERQMIGPLILKWAEEKIPALDGRRPREAVETAAGRQAVVELIDGWEAIIVQGGKQLDAEFNALRRSLGLPEA